jgi:hypothetical protein
VNFAVLGKSFVLSLLLSPVLAVAITSVLYPVAAAQLAVTARTSCARLAVRAARASGPGPSRSRAGL